MTYQGMCTILCTWRRCMITAKVSDYRSHLSSFHKRVISDHDLLLISGQDGNVVILPEDDYENLI